MAQATFWWLLAGGAVALELVTGTFYLLMLAVGLAAGALSAHAGLGLASQMVAAAVAGVVGVIVLTVFKKKSQGAILPSSSNPDVNMDVGETVQVDAWGADGTASVKYRGAQWTVMHRPGNSPAPGPHRVAEVIGSRLLVDRI